MFLVSCGQMMQEDDKSDEQTYTQKNGDIENRSSLDRGQPTFVNIEADQMLLEESSWTCKQGSDEIKYYIDYSQTTIDDEGTEVERRRICELFSDNKNAGTVTVLKYAHWTKDACQKGLTKVINER
ncbi:MAG: hypothetical protein OXC37_03260, partial [Bdellovibrionaceae bacterium]|nr:hypothetical protein [Pseudobdellovibrionaceae bacterium]